MKTLQNSSWKTTFCSENVYGTVSEPLCSRDRYSLQQGLDADETRWLTWDNWKMPARKSCRYTHKSLVSSTGTHDKYSASVHHDIMVLSVSNKGKRDIVTHIILFYLCLMNSVTINGDHRWNVKRLVFQCSMNGEIAIQIELVFTFCEKRRRNLSEMSSWHEIKKISWNLEYIK